MPEEAPLVPPADEQKVSARISSTISSEMSVEEIKRLVVGICLDAIPSERGYLGLFPLQEESRGGVTSTWVYDKPSDSLPRPLRIVLFGYIGKYQEPLLVNGVSEDSRFSGCDWEGMVLRSVLAVPL